jgi:hypothetical protein
MVGPIAGPDPDLLFTAWFGALSTIISTYNAPHYKRKKEKIGNGIMFG